MTSNFKLFISATSESIQNIKTAKGKKVDITADKDWVKTDVYQEGRLKRVKIPKRDTGFTFDDLLLAISTTESELGLPDNLLLSVIRIESVGDPRSISGQGAVGFAQMREDFRKHWKVKDPHYVPDVVPKMGAALKHFYNLAQNSPNKDNYKGFGWDNSWELAAMMYNRGAQGVLDWLGRGAPMTGQGALKVETLDYANSMAHLMKGGIESEIPTMRSKWEQTMPLSGQSMISDEDME